MNKRRVVRKDKETAVVRKVSLRRRVTVLDMLARLEAKAAVQDAMLAIGRDMAERAGRELGKVIVTY